jgi:sporulation protein YlmC with PRC-barrel domain
MTTELRLDWLLGRKVMTANNRVLGRIEEFVAEERNGTLEVMTFIVGPIGLIERLGIGLRLLIGTVRPRGYAVQWDQLDLTNAHRPRLTCPVDQLRRL